MLPEPAVTHIQERNLVLKPLRRSPTETVAAPQDHRDPRPALRRYSGTVSVRVSRLGLLSGWCRCSLFVTQFPNDLVRECLSSDLSVQRGRCQSGARSLA
jgi:hypothetical protein